MSTNQRLTSFAAMATLLGAFCLGAVFTTGGWVGPTVLAVVVVAAACAAARALPLPRALVPFAGLLALFLYETISFAHGAALWGFIPSAGSTRRLVELGQEGARDIERFAAPVTVADGLVLLTSAGVGLVAVLVDTVAVTLRRCALAGLPLLALYSVPAAVAPDGVSWLAFAVGAAGYLTLLLTDARERVGRWGRTLARSSSSREASPLAAVGRRVGFAAVAVAIAVPAALPGLDDGVLGFGGSGTGGGNGSSVVQVDNPILNLAEDLNSNRSDNRVLTYKSTTQPPRYLRQVTLDTFIGNQWGPRQLRAKKDQTVDRGMGLPPGLDSSVRTRPVTTEVEVDRRFDSRWLPLPYAAQRVQVDDGRWLFDRGTWNVYSADSTTRQRRYSVESLDITPTPEQLAAAGSLPAEMSDYLKLPDDMSEQLRATAEEKTAGLSTSYQKAIALQQWLRSFGYDERAPSEGGASAMDAFLQVQRGFCVHFASAMALAARSLGIPARVSVGYLPGERDPDRDGWMVVTQRDRHAWPELYFAGVGWVPFEPTPPTRANGVPPYANSSAGAGGGAGAGATQAPTTGPTAQEAPRNPKTEELERRELGGPSELEPAAPLIEPDGAVPWRWIVVGLVALLVAVAPATARIAVRRRRWGRAVSPIALAEAAWRELLDTARDLGLAVDAERTPRRYADELATHARLTDEARAALARLVHAVERARYARAGSESLTPPGRRRQPAGERTDASAARADLRLVVDAVAAPLRRSRRWRARLLPASTQSLLHSATERIADGLDWLDALSGTVRGRLLPRRRIS